MSTVTPPPIGPVTSVIKHRSDFGKLCNAMTLKGVAIEVGTDLGIFAREFMAQWEGAELICIDTYKPYEWMHENRLPDLLMAVQALAPWHGKVRIVQEESTRVAANLPKWIRERVQFVYIDATHTYPAVRADIAAWWPIVQPGGLLAGHDYTQVDHPGVVQAVDEFVEEVNLPLHVVKGDFIPSWYVVKPKQ